MFSLLVPYFPHGPGEIYYRESGKGRTALLLVHGWYQNGSQAWGALLPYLEAEYRVFTPDLPGHGLSALPRPEDFSLAQIDTLLLSFIEFLKKKKKFRHVLIAGHSYGAFAVQRLLALAPGTVSGAVALAAIDNYAPYTRRLKSVLAIPFFLISLYYRLQAILALFPYGDRMLLYGQIMASLIPGRLQYAKIKNRTLSIRNSHAYMRAFLNARVPWAQQPVQTPLLLVYGERDALTSSKWAKQIVPHTVSGQVVVVPEAGHNVQISGAAMVAGHMNQFFEKCFRHRVTDKHGTHASRRP